jgi:aryl-alcohol dehydrogenase-like predicted oxidoreductase
MRKRTLGRTGLEVSELGLGGLFTSSLGGGARETARILERALDLGITFLDTAPAYADSEQLLGQALRRLGPRAGSLVLSTKLGGRPKPFDPRDPKGLRASVEESRRLLDREVLDVLLIHEPDRPQLYDWWSDPRSCSGPVLDLVRRLKEEGVIRAYGLGGTTVAEMSHCVRTGNFEVLLTAFNYNALYREAADELLPAAFSLGMGVLIGSIYGQRGLGRRFDREVRERPPWLSRPRQQQLLAFYALADQSGLPVTELSLRFVLSNPSISCALIGAKSAEQLEASAEAGAKGPLPADLLRELDRVAAMVPFRPFEEPMILPFGKDYHGPGLPNLGAGIPVGRL